MEQMSGMDAMFVATERPVSPVHIATLCIYDPSTAPEGFIGFKDVLSFIESRLHLCSTLRRKMVKVPFGLDYPYWVEDSEFDLEYHVRHLALPKPGDWRQFCIQAARIFSRPLDLTRPPWELTVISGLDNIKGMPKGSFGIINKVHHSAIDGVSGIEMVQALHTLSSGEQPPQSKTRWRPETTPTQIGLFARSYGRMLTGPVRRSKAIMKIAPGLYKVGKGMISKGMSLSSSGEAPNTRFNTTISPHRMFDARFFDRADINAIREMSEGSKLNDVMLSVVGGALRLYLKDNGEESDKTMTAAVPINVRAKDENNKLGNQVSGMIVPLGTNIASAMERFQFVHAETQQAKTMTSTLGARELTDLIKLMPATVLNTGAKLHSRLKLARYTKKIYQYHCHQYSRPASSPLFCRR